MAPRCEGALGSEICCRVDSEDELTTPIGAHGIDRR